MTDVEKALKDWDMEHEGINEKEINEKLNKMIGELLSAEMIDTDVGVAVKVLLPSSENLAYTMLLSIIESVGNASGDSFENILSKIISLKESGLIQKTKAVEK